MTDYVLALGHVRLSIIDINSGQQPLLNQHGDIHAVVNGELYDYKRIRSELEAKGYRFKTNSDSEIALCLYEEYGISFLNHLRGEFAIAIWDSKRNRFIIAKDRFGIKPLYYTQVNGTLLAASEIKAFLPLGWKPEWNVDSVLNNSVMFNNRTAFKGVNQLPASHYLMATLTGSVQISPYWCAKYPDKSVKETRSIDEIILGVREQLIESVKQRLVADVPIGIYLSGGIDSSCIGGIINELKKQNNIQGNTKAFSLAFVDDDNFNEGPIAKRTAEFCNADFQLLEVTESDLLSNFKETVWHTEQLHFNLNSVGKYMLSRNVRKQGYKAILTGEGSDEHFAGYIHFQADYLLEHDFSSPEGLCLLSKQEREKKLETFSSQKEFKKYTKTDFVDDSNDISRRMLNNVGLPSLFGSSLSLTSDYYSKTAIEQYGIPNPVLTIVESLSGVDHQNAVSKWHPLHTSLHAVPNSLLPNYLLNSLGDRVEMAHSVEGRTPFLDHILCDYINSLPPSTKLKSNKDGILVEKWVLKDAVKPYVTQEIYERTKVPFFAPPTKKPNPAFINLLNKYIAKENIEKIGWINYEQASVAKRRYLETNDLRTYQDLMIIMSFIIISIRFGVATYEPANVDLVKNQVLLR